jgi:acyl carrier protein
MQQFQASSTTDHEVAIVSEIRSLLDRREGADAIVVTLNSNVHDDLDLDSLELAELSAVLEERFGHDPYTQGIAPRTVGEIVAYYR